MGRREIGTPKQLLVTAAVCASVAGALYVHQRNRPFIPSKRLAQLDHRHTRGENRRQQAERGTPGEALLHQVARALVGSSTPLTHPAPPHPDRGTPQRHRARHTDGRSYDNGQVFGAIRRLAANSSRTTTTRSRPGTGPGGAQQPTSSRNRDGRVQAPDRGERTGTAAPAVQHDGE